MYNFFFKTKMLGQNLLIFLVLISLIYSSTTTPKDFLFDFLDTNESSIYSSNTYLPLINSNNVLELEPSALITDSTSKKNLKLKKQKLIFGKTIFLWKRSAQQGYAAFLMLCEPDITCVTPQIKQSIANCMNTGNSALANQLYNSCSNQNRLQCTDQDVARRLLACLRLQSSNNVLISPQSRACVRQVVTLGTLDCFVRILRQKPKFRLGTRYSTASPDTTSAAATGNGGDAGGDGADENEPDVQNNARNKREINEMNDENFNKINILEDFQKEILDLPFFYKIKEPKILINNTLEHKNSSLINKFYKNNEAFTENQNFTLVENLDTNINSTKLEFIDDFEEIDDNEDEDNSLEEFFSPEINFETTKNSIDNKREKRDCEKKDKNYRLRNNESLKKKNKSNEVFKNLPFKKKDWEFVRK